MLRNRSVRMWIGLQRPKITYVVQHRGQYNECSKSITGITLSASEELWSMAPGLENSSELSTWLSLINLRPNQRNGLKLIPCLLVCFILILFLAYEIWDHMMCWLSGRVGETRNAYRCLSCKILEKSYLKYQKEAGCERCEARSSAWVLLTAYSAVPTVYRRCTNSLQQVMQRK